MNEIKIERNIPVPSTHKTGFTDILKKCKIGDSFLWPQWNSGLYATAGHGGMKIIIRKQPDGTYRVWRKS